MRRSERLLHGKAVRWSPKLRVADVLEMCCQAEDGQGKPVLDEKGEERRGVEALASDSPRVDEYPERMNGTEIASASALQHLPRACSPSTTDVSMCCSAQPFTIIPGGDASVTRSSWQEVQDLRGGYHRPMGSSAPFVCLACFFLT